MALARYAKGTKIHVRMDVVIEKVEGGSPYATSEVTEVSPSSVRWTHYLYLNSYSLYLNSYSLERISGSKAIGETIHVDFDAKVAKDNDSGPKDTARVYEITENGRVRNTHYLFLNSAAITELTQETSKAAEPERPVTLVAESERPAEEGPTAVPEKSATALAKGTKIQVDLTAAATGTLLFGSDFTTIREAFGRFTHYLNLGSDKVSGGKVFGETVRAVFTAEVAGNYRGSVDRTTLVRELRSKEEGGIYGFSHYLSLDSPAVTILTDKPAEPEEAAAPEPTAAKGSTVRIDQSAITISDTDVNNRITELESAKASYDIIRLRNDEVLATFDDEDDAEAYIRDEDYDRARVVVRAQELNANDQQELDDLQELRDTLSGTGPLTISTYTPYTTRVSSIQTGRATKPSMHWASPATHSTSGRSTSWTGTR